MKITIRINYRGEFSTIELRSEFRDAMLAAFNGIPVFDKTKWKLVKCEGNGAVHTVKDIMVPAVKSCESESVLAISGDWLKNIEISDSISTNYIDYCNESGAAVNVQISSANAGTGYCLAMLTYCSKPLGLVTSQQLIAYPYTHYAEYNLCANVHISELE